MRGQNPRQSTSNYAEKYHIDAASERFPALLMASHTIALHLNKDWVSWGEGRGNTCALKARGRGNAQPSFPPCPATAMTMTTATTMDTASRSPEAGLAWSELGLCQRHGHKGGKEVTKSKERLGE